MMIFRHDAVAPGLHRFVFPSKSRRGLRHTLLVDTQGVGAERLNCSCDASLYGRLCRHKRFIITGRAA